MPDPSVYAVILAAGGASRFGSPKQLAELDGVPLVARAVRAARTACGSRHLLVCGAEWQRVAIAAGLQQGFFCINDDWQSGLGTSIGCGVSRVAKTADAVLLMLADQPRVGDQHLCELVERWTAAPQAIVATAYAGTRGTPAVFPRRDFGALCTLAGDRGAKALIEAEAGRVTAVDCEDAACDVDRPEDLLPR